MSPKEGSPYLERIKGLRERVSKLGEKGTDVTRVNKILDNLDSSVDTVDDKKKIEEAFAKFENLIKKMENKEKVAPKKKVTKKEAIPKEEKKEEPAPEEEKPIEPEPPENEKEGEQITAPESPPVKVDIQFMDKEVQAVDELVSKIVELEGDPSPIKPHIDALKNARDSKNIEEFQNYLKASRDWLVQYLTSLHKAGIEGIVEQFNSKVSDFIKVDEEERIRALKIEMEKITEEYENAGDDDLEHILSKVRSKWNIMEEAYQKLTEEITILINKITESIETELAEASEEIDTTSLKNKLQEVKEHLFNGEYAEAWLKGQELQTKAAGEMDSKDLKKLESMLLSIEPLIAKIEASEGSGSESYKNLKEEREYVVERSKSDVKEALKLMEDLLDKTTKVSADIEEKNIRVIEDRLKNFKDEARSLSDTMDVSPIMNILEKASSLLMEGNVEKANFMIDKAETAFEKLKGKRGAEVASFRINEIKERVDAMGEKGIDTSPMEEPIASALKAVESGNMESFEKNMSIIDKKFLFIRNEELKVDYQKGLIKVVNSLKELRDDGQDVSDLEVEMESFKSQYMERHFEEAVAAAEVLLHKTSGRKLYKVIHERKSIVEETLKEAEGLLVEVEIPMEKLNSAKDFIEHKDFESALDLLIEAQVELEERMTQRTFSLVEKEIRDLVKECTENSIEHGDFEKVISSAYSMADEEKFREAMELLSKFREKLARKVAQSKVEGLMKKMVQLIKKGRTVGLQVTPYKASMTKSKVLLDAGDVEAAYQLVSRQVDTLEATISERRELVARLDKLRGNLLAQEGKLSRLERSGVSVEEFKERVEKVKQLIEDSNHNEAEEELLAMDQDINRLLTMKPEQLKREMMTTIMEEQESRPLSIDRLKPVSIQRDSGPIDTDQARSELFTLIPKIKLEISKLHSQGLETEDYKMDIERIQNLVIKRQYLQAYELGKTCYRRMTSQ
jgi:hypothetical protein